jgi:hypothetical protein
VISANHGVRTPFPTNTPFSKACHNGATRWEQDDQIVQQDPETDKYLWRSLRNFCVPAVAYKKMIENKGCRLSTSLDLSG